MKKLLTLFLFAMIIMSCDDEKDENPLKELPGTWVWTSSCGGFTGLCSYPDETNYKSIQITNDRFILSENGQITRDESYEIVNIEISETNYPYEKSYELRLDGGEIIGLTFFQNRDLIFLPNDFLVDTYKRKLGPWSFFHN